MAREMMQTESASVSLRQAHGLAFEGRLQGQNIQQTHCQWAAIVCMLSAALLGGCAAPASPPVSADLNRQQLEGYGLLYKLMSDDSSVAEIFIIKNADPPVIGLAREIARNCQDAKAQLDAFAKSDPSLHLDVSDLPAAEQESRDSTASQDEKELLSSSGKAFELRLLFTQAQAMGYASELSKAVASHEDDATRKNFLMGLSDKCAGYRDRAMEMLAVK
jgi:hypothetical protein